MSMFAINATNVNDAYVRGMDLLLKHGVLEQTRAGECLVMPAPVVTQYNKPMQRVLWDPVRNANPFFHLAEALWMLAGQRDARFLDKFVSDFSSRFAEEDGQQHGAYGYRWRRHFDLYGGGDKPVDQLTKIVRMLQKNPGDRRAVLAMWDPLADLGADKKDIPCNTHAYFRVREPRSLLKDEHYGEKVLDMTVCCRSNDLVWGAYGANAVHFSVLQEYLAARIGVRVGTYYQFSNNYHAYKATLPTEWSIGEDYYALGVTQVSPIVTHPDKFDEDLVTFFATYDDESAGPFHNPFLGAIARPMFKLYERRRELTQADLAAWGNHRSNTDWGIAAVQWLDRWMKRRKA